MKNFVSILRTGLIGYAIFFSTLLLSKFLGSVVSETSFRIENGDLEICLIGLVFFALIDLLEKYREKRGETNFK